MVGKREMQNVNRAKAPRKQHMPTGLFCGERGNAMVLAALILLGLTSVGLVSIQQTNSGLMAAGNISRATKASLAGEAGIVHTLSVLGARPDSFTRAIEMQRKLAATGGGSYTDPLGNTQQNSNRLGMTILKRSSSLPDPSGADINMHLPAINSLVAGIPQLQQAVAYDGRVVWVGEGKGIGGWQADADWCFETFDVNSRGGIPNGAEAIVQTLCPNDVRSTCTTDADCTAPARCVGGHCVCMTNTVVVETRARTMAGPSNCAQR